MTAKYAEHVQTKQTPQSEQMPGTVANSAGGFSFPVDCWTRLDRFLILGAEGGSYYATERTLTKEAATSVLQCADIDAEKTVRRIVDISQAGRAPKNDPAIFALALLSSHAKASHFVKSAIPAVCRIGTHILHFAAAADAMRGWGRSLRAAVASWYSSQEAGQLAYQVAKYQSRDGWSHRDLLRLAHPKADGSKNIVQNWAVKGWPEVGEQPHDDEALLPIWAFERAKRAADAKEVCRLVRLYNLPRECVPTQFLNDASVWEALLEKMPMHAMIRNLATMTRIGLLAPMSEATGKVLAELASTEKIHKARVHPIAVLSALKTYASGRGVKSDKTWCPVSQIIDALDGAFYKAFANVESTGKRWLLALDVSGSMGQGDVAGVPGLTPRVASSAMALVTAATEPQHAFVAFTSNGSFSRPSMHQRYRSGLTPLTISPRQRIDDVCSITEKLPMGGTDCALPMIYATEAKVAIDTFVVLTDSETRHGDIHPAQALRKYRQTMGIAAKLIVVGMVANKFSIADPKDGGMLDVVGFDASAPAVMNDFVKQAS
jgi:60 kDa SS-A/Ro ribonucleoprotein